MERRADSELRARTIGDVAVQVPLHYREGDTITAGEAAMLNQTLAENISNNLRVKIEKFIPEGSPEGTAPRVATPEEAQALVDAYFLSYTPGVRQGGGGGGARALTPVETEVRNLATAKLKDILRAKGLKQKDVPFTDLRDKIIAQHNEALTAQAKKVIAAREKASIGDDDILGSVVDGLPGVGGSDASNDEGTGEEAAA